ncbi:MAG: hypothetical protein AAGA68_20435 [Pseudomonadota bacterium]
MMTPSSSLMRRARHRSAVWLLSFLVLIGGISATLHASGHDHEHCEEQQCASCLFLAQLDCVAPQAPTFLVARMPAVSVTYTLFSRTAAVGSLPYLSRAPPRQRDHP